MNTLTRYPLFVAVFSFFAMLLSARIGLLFGRRRPKMGEEIRQDLDMIVASVLTLLGLIIGFSFSMATNRYDLRKNYEEAEANAIGTEYLRADLLPAKEAGRVRVL